MGEVSISTLSRDKEFEGIKIETGFSQSQISTSRGFQDLPARPWGSRSSNAFFPERERT
uniref:Uncharacterized protein n=1 Tax=Vombatus ursinus TaxID=29139 RepID=A0A4X2K767_VOMUR